MKRRPEWVVHTALSLMNFDEWSNQLRTKGWIQPIQFGMSRENVRALFGEPDAIAKGWRKAAAPMVLKYGRIEFHFGPESEDGLSLIYSDNAEGRVDLCLCHGKPLPGSRVPSSSK